MSAPRAPDRTEHVLAALCLGVALAFHAWGASVGWMNLNLPGCEFRQTQTAISAHFILQEKNYSLAYPTPVLGKPWSIPLEFPLYQWTVARVAEVTGWPLTQVGRGVSLACFYLTLPALYGLLRRIGLLPPRALVVLAFIVGCPLYIFYARAFLIETMAWMFGCWFLLGYVTGVERRSPAWLAAAIVGGTGAGLVKVTTLMAFLFPALAWTFWWFWRDWRENPGAARWTAWGRRVIGCAAAVAVPFAAAVWWVKYADRLKAQSVTAAFMQSDRLTGYNFGTGVRFDPALWNQHWNVILHEIATVPVLLVAGLLALVFARARWAVIGLSVAFFFAVQLVFPVLYAWHEYYYVAIAMLLMLPIGLAACGVLESRVPRGVAWVVVAGLMLAQGRTYFVRYYDGQRQWSPGGSELTVALKKATDPDDVIIVAGNDWSSMIPYYAQRRALMIRRGLETTWQEVDPALAALRDEPVAALVLFGEQRGNQGLLDRAVRLFALDPRPAFTWQEADVYLRRACRAQDLELLTTVPGITLPADYQPDPAARTGREVDVSGWLPRHTGNFAKMAPRPWKYFSAYGLNPAKYDGREYVWVHPETRLWFRAPAGARRLVAGINFVPDAFDEKLAWQDRTDGVEIVVAVQLPGAERRVVGRRLLDPRGNPQDGGRQALTFDFTLDAAGDVEFDVLPGPAGSLARDWVLLETLKIE